MLIGMVCLACRWPWGRTESTPTDCPFCGSKNTSTVAAAPVTQAAAGTPYDQMLARSRA